MTFEYVTVDEAIARPGLRMVVVGGASVGWNEAAKGILHVKGIDWAAVRLDHASERLRQWAGQRSGPVAIYEREPPRSGWSEILMLAERIALEPRLVPDEPEERASMFGLAHELCGEWGLGWARRLQLIHAGLHGTGGFPEPIARYLGKKYGYSAAAAATCGPRVTQLLAMFAARLKAQREAGSRYYLGASLTALDIYGASFLNMFDSLPHERCPMDPSLRAAFDTRDAATEAALDPILLEHRAWMYEQHLAWPLHL